MLASKICFDFGRVGHLLYTLFLEEKGGNELSLNVVSWKTSSSGWNPCQPYFAVLFRGELWKSVLA